MHKTIVSFVMRRLNYIKITQNKSYNTLSHGNMIFLKKQTVLLYLLNIQKTIILKDKYVTLVKFRNIPNTMKLNIYYSNSMTLAPLKINSTFVLKTKMVYNMIFICSMHIFVHFFLLAHLRVSYCHHPLSVVRRRLASGVLRQQLVC